MEQLFCHLIGDYFLQNDWMALNKKKDFRIALLHGFVYTLPFIFLTRSILALCLIWLTHSIIDGTNFIGRINQIKNWNFNFKSGYDEDTRPIWIWVWLSIIQDNTLHLILNYYIIRYWG